MKTLERGTLAGVQQQMNVVARAVALQESGLLVQGLDVIDLSTGEQHHAQIPQELRQMAMGDGDYLMFRGPSRHEPFCYGAAQVAHAVSADDASVREAVDLPYRQTGLSLTVLEALDVAVNAALRGRMNNPEWAEVNPPEARFAFPWGLGIAEPDVLVSGLHAGAVASFLRDRGKRARVVHIDQALSIAADLDDLPDLFAHDASLRLEPVPSAQRVSPEMRQTLLDRRIKRDRGQGDEQEGGISKALLQVSSVRLPAMTRRSKTLAVLAVGSVVMLGAAVGVRVAASMSEDEAATVAADASAAATAVPGAGEEFMPDRRPRPTTDPPQEAPDVAPPATHGGQGAEFANPSIAGSLREQVRQPRAVIPVRIDVPGWQRVGATDSREEFLGADPDMRILVAAKPTPLESQEALDQAVITAIGQAGDGIEISGTQPVRYREVNGTQQTEWTVRLVDGHQISIGCQVREGAGEAESTPRLTEARAADCARAVDTAEVDHEAY